MNTDWYQQALTPPQVLELRIKVGVVPDADHLQAQVELIDPTTSVLLGQWSYPHSSTARLLDTMQWVVARAVEALGDHCEPF